MAESTQHKLDRVRPPRVHITYDVQNGDTIKEVEIPFVVGIMSDLAGKQEDTLPRLKDRKFIDIDKDTFNDVMAAIRPRISFNVESKIPGQEGGTTGVNLEFKHLDDFNPINIVNQIDSLRKLYDARQRLFDLTAKLDGNDKLNTLLQEIIQNNDSLKQLKQLTGETNGEES